MTWLDNLESPPLRLPREWTFFDQYPPVAAPPRWRDPLCHARRPTSPSFTCTRTQDHTGRHAKYGHLTVLAVWEKSDTERRLEATQRQQRLARRYLGRAA